MFTESEDHWIKGPSEHRTPSATSAGTCRPQAEIACNRAVDELRHRFSGIGIVAPQARITSGGNDDSWRLVSPASPQRYDK